MRMKRMKYVPGLDANWRLRWEWTFLLWWWKFLVLVTKPPRPKSPYR